jgi:hypothetical protein
MSDNPIELPLGSGLFSIISYRRSGKTRHVLCDSEEQHTVAMSMTLFDSEVDLTSIVVNGISVNQQQQQ